MTAILCQASIRDLIDLKDVLCLTSSTLLSFLQVNMDSLSAKEYSAISSNTIGVFVTNAVVTVLV